MRLKLLPCLILICGLSASAETLRTQGLSFHADHYTRDSENETEELEGHVQVIYQNQHLKCDRAVIHARAKTVDAIGDVLITTPRANIGGDRIVLNLEDNTGVIYNGYVQSGTVLFQGSMIFRTSEIDYIADDAEYTTCTTCPEAWTFSGTKIRAQLGGYAYIRNSTLRLGGLPVFWLPYMVVPLKSQRQTGFLTPGFGSDSAGGLTVIQPYFWAISPSQDATFSLENYEKRGPKGLLEYNYVINPSSNGTLKFAEINDRVFALDPRFQTFHPRPEKSVERWDFNYQHYYEMPENFTSRMQLANASDLQYLNDFTLETHPSYDPAMEDRFSVSKVDGRNLYTVDSSYYTNLLQSNPLANNNDAVHRLPELNWSRVISPTGFDEVMWSSTADFTNFTRNGPGYDHLNAPYVATPTAQTDPGGRYIANNCPPSPTVPGFNNPYYTDNPNCSAIPGGAYNSNTDLIRTGQRFDFEPTLYRPFRVGTALDFLPTLSYRETDYNFGFGDQPTLSRKYLQGGMSLRSSMSRIYGDLEHTDGERIKHEIQPELSYTKIPWFQQRNSPFFGTAGGGNSFTPNTNQAYITNSDLNSPFSLQFDYDDRVGDRDLIQLSLSNFLTKKSMSNGAPNYLQFFSWKLTQGYDFLEASSSNPARQPITDLESDLRFTLPHFQAVQQLNYYPYQHVSTSDTSVKVTDDRQDVVNLRYSSRYNITPDQPVDRSTRNDQYSIIARRYGKAVDFIGTVAYGNPGPDSPSRFTLWAYGAEFKIPGDCTSIQLFYTSFPKPQTEFHFGFVWDGQANSNFIKALSASAPFGI